MNLFFNGLFDFMIGQLEVPPGLQTEPVVNKISENVPMRHGRRSLCPPPSPSPLANDTPK